MKCAECKGACCEVFELPFRDIQPPNEDVFGWLVLHGVSKLNPDPCWSTIQFDCKCTKLTEQGSCGIYDERPDVCRRMPVGGSDCLEFVRERRTPEEYKAIRDDDDPATIHV
jgi:Fe-S-cluster containining protein